MVSLDKKQVQLIAKDVGHASITITHLADNLIDHICCEVEQLMDKGQSFDLAYEKVKQQFGISVLKKIEEDTKYLIDKKYRLMKTTMKIAGNISLAIILVGTVFKIMHWPGAGYMLAFGFLVVCSVFFPLALYINYRDSEKKQNLALHLSAFVGGVVFMLGVVFKIMHWPGGGVLLLVGDLTFILLVLPLLLFTKLKNATEPKEKRVYYLGALALIIYILSNLFKFQHWPGASVLMFLGGLLLIVGFLPMYTWQRIQLEGKITGQFIYTIILAMFFVLFTSLLALNVSNDYLAAFVDQAKNELAIGNYLEQKNAENLQKINHISSYSPDIISEAKQIRHKADEVCDYMINLQLSLLQDLAPQGNHKELLNHPELIDNKANTEIPKLQMMGISTEGKAKTLKTKLGEFKEELLSSKFSSTELEKMANRVINLSDPFEWNKEITWEQYHFGNSPLITTISKLNEFQTSVRMLESKAIENITNQQNL